MVVAGGGVRARPSGPEARLFCIRRFSPWRQAHGPLLEPRGHTGAEASVALGFGDGGVTHTAAVVCPPLGRPAAERLPAPSREGDGDEPQVGSLRVRAGFHTREPGSAFSLFGN